MPTRSLVRDDLQHWVAATGMVVALVTGQPLNIATVYLPWFLLCQLAWFILRRPAAFFTTWKLDATLLTYTASLAVWLSLGIMTCRFVLSALAKAGVSSGGGSVTDQAITAFLLALGVGAQPILTNFTSGLLIVLFRPFRIGDDVQVGDELFTVQAITAFFVTGTTFKNVHISLPNSMVLATSKPITNYTANTNFTLELTVHVHAGQQPCAVVRAAMNAAADAFEEGLAAILVESGVPDAHKTAAALPTPTVLGPCAITEFGVQWMLKPLVPELAWLPAIDLGNQCIHDALMEAGVMIFEASDRQSSEPAARRRSRSAPRRRAGK